MEMTVKRTSKKSHKESEVSERRGDDEYIDPAEAVRERVERAVNIGSPLLYPF
jgi:hypothetical protein